MNFARWIATVGGIGHLRPAPGTWASLAALPLAWALHCVGGFPALLTGLAAIIALGWWATERTVSDSGDPDPPEIVVDEIAGQILALTPLSFAAWMWDLPIMEFWYGCAAAFAAFRLLDIRKPGPIGWANAQNSAWAVMLDDLLAGLTTALAVALPVAVTHRLIGV